MSSNIALEITTGTQCLFVDQYKTIIIIIIMKSKNLMNLALFSEYIHKI